MADGVVTFAEESLAEAAAARAAGPAHGALGLAALADPGAEAEALGVACLAAPIAQAPTSLTLLKLLKGRLRPHAGSHALVGAYVGKLGEASFEVCWNPASF